jgi:hypothetical protein
VSNQLSKLLAPVSSELFFERYWGREYLYVGRNSGECYNDILRVEDIDLFLQWSRIDTGARGEVSVAVPERLFSLYRQGATLILNQVHQAIPGVSQACRNLAHDLGFPVRANIYITPPGSQGFSPHADDHEILILAISGAKDFLLKPQGSEAIEAKLHAGDLLYIPRGLVHEGRTLITPSVHLSIGLKPVYAFQLVEELASIAREHPQFQQIVPLRGIDVGARRPFYGEYLQQLHALIDSTQLEILANRRFRSFVDRQSAGWPGRFSDLLRIDNMTLDTRLVLREGILTETEEREGAIYLRFAGNCITVPLFLKPSLEWVLRGPAFAVREITGLISNEMKVDFVKPLVAAGILRIL